MRNGEDWSARTVEYAQQAIGYRFKDIALLKACFTHKSYSNVYPSEQNNERLEFLGDSVIQLCVSEALFHASKADEGKLTARRQSYVSQTALEAACKRAGLMEFLRYSGGEGNVGGKTLSNLFEAVVAGIYLDGGMNAARAFLRRFLTEREVVNYKQLLQEYLQARGYGLPDYRCVEEDGGFSCTVAATGKQGTGNGENKQAAEQSAAQSLYEILR